MLLAFTSLQKEVSKPAVHFTQTEWGGWGTWLLWDLLLHSLIPKRKCCSCVWPELQILSNEYSSWAKTTYWLLQSKIALSWSKAMLTISKSRTWCSPPALICHRWHRYFLFFPTSTPPKEYLLSMLYRRWVLCYLMGLFHHQISPIHKKAIPFLIKRTWLCCESKIIQTYQSVSDQKKPVTILDSKKDKAMLCMKKRLFLGGMYLPLKCWGSGWCTV